MKRLRLFVVMAIAAQMLGADFRTEFQTEFSAEHKTAFGGPAAAGGAVMPAEMPFVMAQ